MDELPGRLGRALADNPEGRAIFGAALREAVMAGYAAAVGRERLYPLASGDEVWMRWAPEVQLFDAVGEPRLVDGVESAERALMRAAEALDLTRGGRNAGALRDEGRRAAAAGELLAIVMTSPPEADEHDDRDAAPSPGPALQDMVRVAFAPNQPMAEMLQARLFGEGIPSTRRTDGAEAYVGASAFYEIYVPTAAAERARRLLVEEGAPQPEPTAPRAEARRLVSERPGLRLAGKAGVLLVVFGGAALAVVTQVSGPARVGALMLLALTLVLAVIRSEQA
jgi:hypothetical protein